MILGGPSVLGGGYKDIVNGTKYSHLPTLASFMTLTDSHHFYLPQYVYQSAYTSVSFYALLPKVNQSPEILSGDSVTKNNEVYC